MSTAKLIGFGIAWILAAIAIAVVTSIVLTELLDLMGFVESGQSSYSIALNGIVLAVFVGLVLVPLMFRRRFVDDDVAAHRADVDLPDD